MFGFIILHPQNTYKKHHDLVIYLSDVQIRTDLIAKRNIGSYFNKCNYVHKFFDCQHGQV